MVSTHRHGARGSTACDRVDDAIAMGSTPSQGIVSLGGDGRRSARNGKEQIDVG